MQKRNFSWTAADGVEIYACDWSVSEPKAVVAISHGLGEHIDRYEHMAQWFNAKGFAVMGYDRRGHGRSEGKRGHSLGLAPLLDEIGQLIKAAHNSYKGIPVFLYGHSQGGGLSLSYLLRRNPQIAGVIVSAPWITLAFVPPSVLIMLGKLMRKIYPAFTQPNNLQTDLLSRDKAVVDAYNNDPLVHNQITAAVGIDMLREGEWLLQQKRKIDLPLLILHGEADGVTSAESSEQFAAQIEGDITFKPWAEMYHELHNEPEQEALFTFVQNWIETKL